MSRPARLREQAELAVQAQVRALELKQQGRLAWVADDLDCPELMRLAALAEELGEVARCVHDEDLPNLKVELAQLAGVALAWMKALP